MARGRDKTYKLLHLKALRQDSKLSIIHCINVISNMLYLRLSVKSDKSGKKYVEIRRVQEEMDRDKGQEGNSA